MRFGKILVAAFMLIIFLLILNIASAGIHTENFIDEPTSYLTIFLIIVSFVVIFAIKVPKKKYRPIPSRA